ncbi:MAG: cytochrome c-550 PedF [Pseudomonadota bacterium]
MKAGVATLKTTAIVTALIALGSMTTMRVEAHGDVVPQAVDVSTLKALGAEWRKENPYRGDKEAIRIGSSAYNQNCARCHGLEAVSGGIAPDLRMLPVGDAEADDYFLNTVRRGRVRNGAVYMPPFEEALSQEAMWAIRAYIETRHEE